MRALSVVRLVTAVLVVAAIAFAQLAFVPSATASPNNEKRKDSLVFRKQKVTATASKKTMVSGGAGNNEHADTADKSSQKTTSAASDGSEAVPTGPAGPTYEELVAQVKAHNAAELVKQEQSAGSQSPCAEGVADIPLGPCVYEPDLQQLPQKPQPQQTSVDTAPAPAPVVGASAPRISKQEVWAEVKTSLSLDAATPRVSPDFSVHHQRSVVTGKPLDSVVGYPMWFWAEGGDLAARTTVKKRAGMKVSLSVKPGKVSIDPGDGHPFSCANGTEWTPKVQPGAKSPTCGYTYTKTGTYTVSMTTNWTVHYVIDDGEGEPLIGDETLSGTKTRPMRIGELQVLVVNR